MTQLDWQPIETCPRDAATEDNPILLGWWTMEETPAWQVVVAWWTGEEWDAGNWAISHCDISHWMPMPGPPTGADGENTRATE